MFIHAFSQIHKYNLFNLYDVTCMYVFRSLLFTVLNTELTAKLPSELQALALLFAWVPSCINNIFLLF